MVGPDLAAPRASHRRAQGLGELLGRLLSEARSLVTDYAELAVLDARRAAIRLAWLLGAVLIATVLIVTTWMALVAAGVVFMLGHGTSWVTALIVAAVLNLVIRTAKPPRITFGLPVAKNRDR